MKQKIEIFTAGCPVCNPIVELVKETASESFEITIYDLAKQFEEEECISKMKEYQINRLPSIAVNGELLNCCKNIQITKDDLIAAGIGQA